MAAIPTKKSAREHVELDADTNGARTVNIERSHRSIIWGAVKRSSRRGQRGLLSLAVTRIAMTAWVAQLYRPSESAVRGGGAWWEVMLTASGGAWKL